MIEVGNKALNYGNRVVTTSRIQAYYPIYQAKDFLFFSTPTYQTVQISERDHILDVVFANLNHSCSPNTFIDCRSLTLFAERDIEVGEELTFFYPATEWQMSRPFKCSCGSTNCIETVFGASNMLPDLLQKYKLNKHIELLLQT